jgi:hypothetical protein
MLMFYCFSATALILWPRPLNESADFVGIWHNCPSVGRILTVLHVPDLYSVLDFRCGRGLGRVLPAL